MKTAKQWFDEYAESHQNETNQFVHYICVPIIFFSVIGLLMSIPAQFIESTFGLYNPLIENCWCVHFFLLHPLGLLVFSRNVTSYATLYYWKFLVK
jgi:uncharacterized membrane protein YGL010W